jgi:hypothetical protein
MRNIYRADLAFRVQKALGRGQNTTFCYILGATNALGNGKHVFQGTTDRRRKHCIFMNLLALFDIKYKDIQGSDTQPSTSRFTYRCKTVQMDFTVNNSKPRCFTTNEPNQKRLRGSEDRLYIIRLIGRIRSQVSSNRVSSRLVKNHLYQHRMEVSITWT